MWNIINNPDEVPLLGKTVEGAHNPFTISESGTTIIYESGEDQPVGSIGEDGQYVESSEPCPISVYGRTRTKAETLVRERSNAVSL